jgi:hypothetical protein
MEPIPPTLPFHIAKAYGVSPTPKSGVTVTPVGPGSYTARPAPTDAVDLASASKAQAIRDKLVAAVVAGGVSFENGVATPSEPTQSSRPVNAPIPFYRHPADKNAAATAINLGSRLDTQA